VLALLMVTIGSLAFYIAALLSGAFEREDVELLQLAEKKFGVDLGRIERLLLKFAR